MRWHLHTTTHTQYSVPYSLSHSILTHLEMFRSENKKGEDRQFVQEGTVRVICDQTRGKQPHLAKTRSQTLWVHMKWLMCLILETQGSLKLGLNYVGVLLLWISKAPPNPHT